MGFSLKKVWWKIYRKKQKNKPETLDPENPTWLCTKRRNKSANAPTKHNPQNYFLKLVLCLKISRQQTKNSTVVYLEINETTVWIFLGSAELMITKL